MRYILGAIFIGFVLMNIYVIHANRGAMMKRKWYRWLVWTQAAFLLALTAFTVDDLFLLVFVIPVLAWIVFASLKFRKFCEWCGWSVQTNLPFTDEKHCPRCGSDIS